MADILHRNPRGTAAAWASPRALTAADCRTREALLRPPPPPLVSAPGKRAHARESRKGPELAARTLPVPARPPILGPTMADKLLSPTSAPGRPDLPLSRLTSTHTSQFLPHSRHGLGLRPRIARHRRPEGPEGAAVLETHARDAERWDQALLALRLQKQASNARRLSHHWAPERPGRSRVRDYTLSGCFLPLCWGWFGFY